MVAIEAMDSSLLIEEFRTTCIQIGRNVEKGNEIIFTKEHGKLVKRMDEIQETMMRRMSW